MRHLQLYLLLISTKQILFLFITMLKCLLWFGFPQKQTWFKDSSTSSCLRGDPGKTLIGEIRSEIGKERQSRKSVLLSQLPWWATRVWSYWRTLMDGIEHGSVIPKEKCENEVFIHHIPIHQWLKAFLTALTPWHFWLALHTGQACLYGQ